MYALSVHTFVTGYLTKFNGQFRTFSELLLKLFEFEVWYAKYSDYPSIILLHSQGNPSPTHFLWGRNKRTSIALENRCFMPHFGGSPLGTGGLL